MEDDNLLDAEDIPETGYVDESGQLRRPWCPATRILDHREAAAEAAAAEEKRRAAQTLGGDGLGLEAPEPPPRTCFPEVKEGEPLYQKNEGEQRRGGMPQGGRRERVGLMGRHCCSGDASFMQPGLSHGARLALCRPVTVPPTRHVQASGTSRCRRAQMAARCSWMWPLVATWTPQPSKPMCSPHLCAC